MNLGKPLTGALTGISRYRIWRLLRETLLLHLSGFDPYARRSLHPFQEARITVMRPTRFTSLAGTGFDPTLMGVGPEEGERPARRPISDIAYFNIRGGRTVRPYLRGFGVNSSPHTLGVVSMGSRSAIPLAHGVSNNSAATTISSTMIIIGVDTFPSNPRF